MSPSAPSLLVFLHHSRPWKRPSLDLHAPDPSMYISRRIHPSSGLAIPGLACWHVVATERHIFVQKAVSQEGGRHAEAVGLPHESLEQSSPTPL